MLEIQQQLILLAQYSTVTATERKTPLLKKEKEKEKERSEEGTGSLEINFLYSF
jgi:hypothetical protein